MKHGQEITFKLMRHKMYTVSLWATQFTHYQNFIDDTHTHTDWPIKCCVYAWMSLCTQSPAPSACIDFIIMVYRNEHDQSIYWLFCSFIFSFPFLKVKRPKGKSTSIFLFWVSKNHSMKYWWIFFSFEF